MSTTPYTFIQAGDKYIISLENHCEIVEAIATFCRDNNITAGIVGGIGAVNTATLRFFNPSTKKYIDKTFTEQMEIANLTGNISTLHGNIYLHLHATFGREDYTALAGHLLTATLSGAGEIVIERIDATLPRRCSPEIGLNIYDL